MRKWQRDCFMNEMLEMPFYSFPCKFIVHKREENITPKTPKNAILKETFFLFFDALYGTCKKKKVCAIVLLASIKKMLN